MAGIPPITEIGSGSDNLLLRVSGTQFGGVMPSFTVSVNGQPLGGVFTAQSIYGRGSDTILLRGDWGQAATLSVDYINDDFDRGLDWTNPASAMTPGNDRNLFIDGIEYNGAPVAGGAQAIYDDRYDVTPISTRGDARAGTGAFDALDQVKAADPNFNVDQYLAGGGFSNFDVNGYLAGGDGVSTGGTAAPVPVSTDAFDFNGMRWKIQHVEDFGRPDWVTNLWGTTLMSPDGVTVSSPAEGGFSGAMGHATGPSAGTGYGLYLLAVNFKVEGNDSGPYSALWPSDDLWPGWEIDLLEFLPGTSTGYATLHWAKDGNRGTGGQANNGFKSVVFDGIDFNGETHFVWADWRRDSITFGVDDKAFATFTDHVPVAFEDGGTNVLPGIGTKGEGTPNSATMMGLVYATPADDGLGVSLGTLTDQPLV